MSDGVKGRGADRPAWSDRARLVLLLLLAGLLAGLAAAPAALAAERTNTWQSIVLLYHSDVGGKVEPCG